MENPDEIEFKSESYRKLWEQCEINRKQLQKIKELVFLTLQEAELYRNETREYFDGTKKD